MRVDNIEVTFKIPLPMDKPDKNGVVYSKEAFENISIEDIYNCPIAICSDDSYDDISIIGVCRDGRVEDDYLIVNGQVWSGGTSETVNLSDEKTITNMTLQSVGININN